MTTKGKPGKGYRVKARPNQRHVPLLIRWEPPVILPRFWMRVALLLPSALKGGGTSSFLIVLICTTRHRVPVSARTDQESKKTIYPALRAGGMRQDASRRGYDSFERIGETNLELSPGDAGRHQPALRARSNCLFQALDLYWRSPESGELWNTSKQ